MSKLKIKFSVYEKRLAMQVIEQASDITGTKNKPIDFKASNGIVISSKARPGVYPSTNEISLRGDESSHDLDIVYGRFDSQEDQLDFINKVNSAFNELFGDLNKQELIQLTNKVGKEIRFKNCSVLFTFIQGQIIFQLLNSNFAKLPAKCFESNNFTIVKDASEIRLPKVTKVPLTCMVNTSDMNESEVTNFLVDVFKILSESEVTSDLNKIGELETYPDFMLSTI